MENNGYVKIYRKLLDNPIICKDSDYFSVWIYLLLNATHTEYDTIFKNERITLKSGQLITGRRVIAEKFNIDENKVQRIITLKVNYIPASIFLNIRNCGNSKDEFLLI